MNGLQIYHDIGHVDDADVSPKRVVISLCGRYTDTYPPL